MKLLLDESVPRRLAASIPDTFDVTADQGIEYQQNLSALPLAVIVLHAHRTRLQDLIPLIPKVVDLLSRNLGKDVYHVAA